MRQTRREREHTLPEPEPKPKKRDCNDRASSRFNFSLEWNYGGKEGRLL